jgi:hypothetical protein
MSMNNRVNTLLSVPREGDVEQNDAQTAQPGNIGELDEPYPSKRVAQSHQSCRKKEQMTRRHLGRQMNQGQSKGFWESVATIVWHFSLQPNGFNTVESHHHLPTGTVLKRSGPSMWSN